MAHDDDAKKVSDVPFTLTQNPAPNPLTGQDAKTTKQELVDSIMDNFRKVLPSTYVAQVTGPWYSLQFQAMAEQLASIQLSTGEIYKDSEWDFTRSDFLWQVLGSLVFPGATNRDGVPTIDGDIPYRQFLHKMVLFLLEGATKKSMEQGIDALDESIVTTITERYLESPPRDPNGAYTIDDQFIVDVFVEGAQAGTFPDDPFILQRNVDLVLAALKPAHVFYSYSYLFRDAFDKIADDSGGLRLDLDSYYYADLRKWCLGAKRIAGTGEVLASRTLFTDPSVSFGSIRPGAFLTITSGANEGSYRVVSTRAFLSGADSTLRSYTLSTTPPVSGTGKVVDGQTFTDELQDWGQYPVGTQITLADGPNAGTYLLEAVLGEDGGLLGTAGIQGTSVRISPSVLQVDRRIPAAATAQPYTVGVDRLGIQTPRPIASEDVSSQFYL